MHGLARAAIYSVGLVTSNWRREITVGPSARYKPPDSKGCVGAFQRSHDEPRAAFHRRPMSADTIVVVCTHAQGRSPGFEDYIKWTQVILSLAVQRYRGSCRTRRFHRIPMSRGDSRIRRGIQRGIALEWCRRRAPRRTQIAGGSAERTCTELIFLITATTGKPTRCGKEFGMLAAGLDQPATSSRGSSSWLPPASRLAKAGSKGSGDTPSGPRSCFDRWPLNSRRNRLATSGSRSHGLRAWRRKLHVERQR